MPASGAPLVVFITGLAFFLVGFIVAFAVLGKHGGLAKSQTFRVISKLPKPAGRVFGAGVLTMVVGGLLTCGGVGAADAAALEACATDCRAAGHGDGRFGPAPAASTPASPSGAVPPKHAPAMCWCVGPAGSVVLRPAHP